jgi:hypothetical protein
VGKAPGAASAHTWRAVALNGRCQRVPSSGERNPAERVGDAGERVRTIWETAEGWQSG